MMIWVGKHADTYIEQQANSHHNLTPINFPSWSPSLPTLASAPPSVIGPWTSWLTNHSLLGLITKCPSHSGIPQVCVLNTLLYSVFIYYSAPVHVLNSIIKFADDTTIVGLIRDNYETAYRSPVDQVAHSGLPADQKEPHTPIYINGAEVKWVAGFKFLVVHISDDLTWATNTSTLIQKQCHCLCFLRRLRKAHLSSQILVSFYCCTIESILTNCISVW